MSERLFVWPCTACGKDISASTTCGDCESPEQGLVIKNLERQCQHLEARNKALGKRLKNCRIALRDFMGEQRASLWEEKSALDAPAYALFKENLRRIREKEANENQD